MCLQPPDRQLALLRLIGRSRRRQGPHLSPDSRHEFEDGVLHFGLIGLRYRFTGVLRRLGPDPFTCEQQSVRGICPPLPFNPQDGRVRIHVVPPSDRRRPHCVKLASDLESSRHSSGVRDPQQMMV